MDVKPDYIVSPARYAKNMMAVKCINDGMWKNRASRLAEVLSRGRYSHRENSYIMSKSKAEKFKQLYKDGWDGNWFGDKLIPPTKE